MHDEQKLLEPRLIAHSGCDLGECPLWHPLEERLYWTDITTGRLFHYDPATGQHKQCYNGAPVGGFTIQPDGSLLLFMARGAVARWNQGSLQYIVKELPGEEESRFNDVIADPVGRVFCGTMPTPKRPGRLYRLDPDGLFTVVLEGIGCSNGMAFTPDNRGMYYTDSATRSIYLFDYDMKTGSLSNQRTWLQTPKGEGVPDGMTVDAEGFVWSARWDGFALYRYSPDAVETQVIRFPVKKITSITFGGKDYRSLYITTASTGGLPAVEGAEAGSVFCIDTGVSGKAEFFSRILL